MSEAARMLGVSRFRMGRLAKRERLETYWAPDDKRRKWISWQDVVRLATPRRPVEA